LLILIEKALILERYYMKISACIFLNKARIKQIISFLILWVTIPLGVTEVMAIEEAKYEVLKKQDRFEIRHYEPLVLAELIVEGDIKQAGSKAFSRLFRYISGENRSRDKIEMTATVSQERRGEKIKMTAPVSLQPAGERWAVSFMMPASYTLQTLPEPEDSDITLRQVPARRMAAVRYSGFWSKKNYLRYKKALELWIQREGLTILGDPIWARYNAPFTLWFLRRNEILIPVDSTQD
jgi:effector-binding domain-containing protein